MKRIFAAVLLIGLLFVLSPSAIAGTEDDDGVAVLVTPNLLNQFYLFKVIICNSQDLAAPAVIEKWVIAEDEARVTMYVLRDPEFNAAWNPLYTDVFVKKIGPLSKGKR